MSLEFEAIFKSLAGSWLLEREISTGETLNGKADFEFISQSAFLLREEGDLSLLNGTVIPASRNWYWHLKNYSTLEITYDQERLQHYHLLNLKKIKNTLSGSAQHSCGDDLYLGTYMFSEKRFEITQTIKGPNKDYSVSSVYSK